MVFDVEFAAKRGDRQRQNYPFMRQLMTSETGEK
jgi:hypothetical protein